ncbi:divalent-cation tolerance protein CutA [bacterium]|nr:divalent-cation tolerance protein CutA [bacterium]
MSSCVVIYCTVPSKQDAKSIAKILLTQRLAACINIIDKVQSIFSWHDEICEEKELLLMIKTKSILFDRVKQAIKLTHPYNIPEIIALPIENADSEYLEWINTETTE